MPAQRRAVKVLQHPEKNLDLPEIEKPMDKIEFRVIRQNGVPIEHHWHALFGIAGGTIGRGGQNKLILSDTDHLVARVHAMVRLETDNAYIANLSESKPIWVADHELRAGDEVVLPFGTLVNIGPFTLCSVPAGTSFSPSAPAETAHAAQPGIAVPAIATAGNTSSKNAATFAGDQAGASSLNTRTPSPLFDWETPPAPAQSAHGSLIPEDFNPFAPKVSQSKQVEHEWNAGLPAPGADDLFRQRHDSMVRSLPLQSEPDSRLHDSSHSGLPACFEGSQVLDPLALFGQSDLPPVSTDLHATARSTELAQIFTLPRVQAQANNAATERRLPTGSPSPYLADQVTAEHPTTVDLDSLRVQAVSVAKNLPTASQKKPNEEQTPQTRAGTGAPGSAPSEAAGATPKVALEELALAFMQGAGLDPAKAQFQVTPEFMQTFGEVLRIAVQGTIDLLSVRSEIKREFRAGVTMIASGANNPLKFLPSAEGVIMQMIHHSFPGFMKPLPAMQDAYLDLQVHQLALMAGIRAAYAEALTRFDPSELERRTDNSSGLLDKILANGRKAALWDDYKHNFDVLRCHAEDDLMAFSGRTFVDAYERAEHVAKGQQ